MGHHNQCLFIAILRTCLTTERSIYKLQVMSLRYFPGSNISTQNATDSKLRFNWRMAEKTLDTTRIELKSIYYLSLVAISSFSQNRHCSQYSTSFFFVFSFYLLTFFSDLYSFSVLLLHRPSVPWICRQNNSSLMRLLTPFPFFQTPRLVCKEYAYSRPVLMPNGFDSNLGHLAGSILSSKTFLGL